MKKATHIVLIVHVIFWSFFLLASIVERIRFAHSPAEMEPLDLLLSKGAYNTFIVLALLGIFNAGLLLFSARPILKNVDVKDKRKRKVAFWFSLTAAILFYLFIVLLFANGSDKLLILPIAWLVCELCCGVSLAVSKKK